jgi:carbonic anhydrase
MDISNIFKKNEEWISDKLKSNKDYFKNLSKGQNPDILYIGCSDSRVTAEEMMGIGPGEAFIHRNMANMVIGIDLNAMTVINYAVDHLKVKHIIVCGHYGCGGIAAAMKSEDLGILNPWLRNIRDVYRTHKSTLDKINDDSERYDKLVELNVQEQCINLIKTAAVQKASIKWNIKIHGWVFDMQTGRLIDLKIDYEEILKGIKEIYTLK